MPTVKIACQHQHGIELSVYSPTGVLLQSAKLQGYGDPAQMLNQHGTVGTSFTEIDADFWSAWLVQNPESPLLAAGKIYPVS